MLHDFFVVHTRPRAIPLVMITMRKSIQGFPFLSYMTMGLYYNINITVLLQGGTALISQEDGAELVSKILAIELCRSKRTPRSVFSDSF